MIDMSSTMNDYYNYETSSNGQFSGTLSNMQSLSSDIYNTMDPFQDVGLGKNFQPQSSFQQPSFSNSSIFTEGSNLPPTFPPMREHLDPTKGSGFNEHYFSSNSLLDTNGVIAPQFTESGIYGISEGLYGGSSSIYSNTDSQSSTWPMINTSFPDGGGGGGAIWNPGNGSSSPFGVTPNGTVKVAIPRRSNPLDVYAANQRRASLPLRLSFSIKNDNRIILGSDTSRSYSRHSYSGGSLPMPPNCSPEESQYRENVFLDRISKTDFNNITVVELKDICREFALIPGGKKSDIINRLKYLADRIIQERSGVAPEELPANVNDYFNNTQVDANLY